MLHRNFDDDENEYGSICKLDNFHIRLLDERHERTCQIVQLMIKKNLQRWFGAEICLSMLFLLVLLHFLRFSLIREYANEIIYISDYRKKGTYLSFYLVPYLMLYDKQHSRYD